MGVAQIERPDLKLVVLPMLSRGVRDDDEGIVVDMLGEEAVGVEDQGESLAERKICDVARHLLRPYPLVHQDVDLAQLRDDIEHLLDIGLLEAEGDRLC